MADNTPRGDHPDEPIGLYDELPAEIRAVVRESDTEWACGPLLRHFRLSGKSATDYADMLRRLGL